MLMLTVVACSITVFANVDSGPPEISIANAKQIFITPYTSII